ncbi:ATP-grasp domain-containing protein [Pigmentibacter ruber]
MKKKLLIIADKLEKVNLKSDSSIALAEAAITKNWEVFWCEDKNIHFLNEEIYLNQLNEIKEINVNKINYEQRKQSLVSFSFFDYCFIRKDPPFNEEYKDLCWILATQTKVKIINPAEALLAYHEKALHWKALSSGVINKNNVISTCLSEDIFIIENYIKENENLFIEGIVCKPWLGHGGEDVQLFSNLDHLINFLAKHSTHNNLKQKYLVQPYLKEIHSEGDRRVIIADGVIIGDFVRIPEKGKIASNLAQGGTAILRDMSNEQIKICESIALFLKKMNIVFAGLDLIGNKIGEINITSPTGLRTVESLTGKKINNIAFDLMVRN